MKTKLLRAATAIAFALLAACSESVDPVDPSDPNVQVPDPAGTITLSMRNGNSGGTCLGESDISIDKADNFTGGYFVSLGKMSGLGNVNRIPKSGWTSKIAVIPGEGYVAWSNDRFYRIFVTGYTTNIVNEIIGAEVKYQTPFDGSGHALQVPAEPVIFECEGGKQEVLFTNDEIIPFTVESPYEGVAKVYVEKFAFLPCGIRIWAPANASSEDNRFEVVVTTDSGLETKIPVTVQGVAPYMYFSAEGAFQEDVLVMPVEYDTPQVTLFLITNAEIDMSALRLSSDATWCRPEYAGDTAVVVRCGMNDTTDGRIAEVTASTADGALQAKVRIIQEPARIEVESSGVELDASAGSSAWLAVYGSSGWKAESDKSWCKVERSEGEGLVITAEENNEGTERRATVRVSVAEGTIYKDVTVLQHKHAFDLSTQAVTFDRKQQNTTLSVATTSSGYTLKSDSESWCTCSSYQDQITIRVTDNSDTDRSATVAVTLDDGQTRKIEVRQSKYAVGDYYEVGKIKGVVFELSGFNGKILSLDETQAQWSTEDVTTGATDEDDGMANMDMIRAIPGWQSLYPAFAWCDAKNTDGITGWYLPAKNELAVIMGHFDSINGTLYYMGTRLYQVHYDGYYHYYLSSTELDSRDNACYCYYYYVDYGGKANASVGEKTYVANIRAVRTF